MNKNTYQVVWGARHDAVVKRYEAKKKNGTAHFVRISTGDEWSDVMKRYESKKER